MLAGKARPFRRRKQAGREAGWSGSKLGIIILIITAARIFPELSLYARYSSETLFMN